MKYPKAEVKKSKLLDEHEEDYYELSGDSVESEVPVEESQMTIYFDDAERLNQGYNSAQILW